MDIDLLEARDARLDRTRECMVLTGTTKDDYVALGFSAAQVRGWFARSGSSKARSPDGAQLIKIWRVFNWSPTYVLFGKGAKLLSQVGVHEDMFERMDGFQAVLQLALDEAEANKERYRGALKTIEDRNQQIALNRETLKAADLSMKENNQKMDLLSDQLAKVLGTS
tara:strand:+ start:138 stop:638 length:501 start_codon:yes stop_codon:yes gene_type:complete